MKINIENYEIAVLIPCFNEAKTIGKVIDDFSKVLPSSKIYVYDNSSTDSTSTIAKRYGAIVYKEPFKGKGNVVKRMFADIQADIYVLVDGDATYDANSLIKMIEELFSNNYDMVVGSRIPINKELAYRAGHIIGNKFLTKFVSMLFGGNLKDMLSGYRVFSKRFVKTFPILSRGFEIETEITIHTLQIGASYSELETPYYARPEGSHSKLNTYKDGSKILRQILMLLKNEKPLFFFGFISLGFFIVSIMIFIPILISFLETGLVLKVPSLLLSVSLMIVAFLSFTSGIILDNIRVFKQEYKRSNYLRFSSLRIGSNK